MVGVGGNLARQRMRMFTKKAEKQRRKRAVQNRRSWYTVMASTTPPATASHVQTNDTVGKSFKCKIATSEEVSCVC